MDYAVPPRGERPMRVMIDTNNADLFLTGDKDFLESAADDPRIISVADFLGL